MTSTLMREQSALRSKPRPELKPGYTVRVHERIVEGEKERIQVFEGLIISVHRGKTPMDTTITVRRIASGVGVERIFPLHSPLIEKIDVKKVAKVRRAKLFFLRGRRGKAARLSERFTTSDEFAIAAAIEEEKLVEEEVVSEPDAGEEKSAKEPQEKGSSPESASSTREPKKEEVPDNP